MSSASRNRVAASAWGQIELPVVDETRCTGCGWCVAVCPTECLAMGKYLPWLPRPLDCVSCELCVLVCPANALQLQARD
jgi:formate hydrogenlyase subunit 6/NADH:ubiquinone oxidoreductase subunit I